MGGMLFGAILFALCAVLRAIKNCCSKGTAADTIALVTDQDVKGVRMVVGADHARGPSANAAE